MKFHEYRNIPWPYPAGGFTFTGYNYNQAQEVPNMPEELFSRTGTTTDRIRMDRPNVAEGDKKAINLMQQYGRTLSPEQVKEAFEYTPTPEEARTMLEKYYDHLPPWFRGKLES